MRIENIELYYLSMPEILDEADGSQDALIVRVDGGCLLYTSPSPRDRQKSRMPSSA